MINNTRLYIYIVCLYISCSCFANSLPDLDWAEKVGARSFPLGTTLYNVSDYGAIPDGVTLNTRAIQKAIDDCASKGGGIVTFLPGKYLSGALFLKEGVHFDIAKGVTLYGSEDIKDYPEIDTRVAGIEMRWPAALINVQGQKNVMISGDGTVHGQGRVFWDSYWAMRKDYEARGLRWIVDYDCKRPRILLVSESSDVTVKGLTLKQSGFWTIQLLYSSYCTVDGVIIQNNVGGHGPSTDGIDIDSSSYVLVENCDIDCNDDNFCLKAGRDADGLRVNRPTEYVVIRNCVSRAGGGLLTCGSETSGGIRYVLADGLKAKGTTVGIRLKSAMNRGGTIEYIYVRNVEMDNVGTVFDASMNWHPAYSYSILPKEYEGRKLPDHWIKMLEKVDPEDGIPYFNNVYLSDFKVTDADVLMKVDGNEDSKMRNFVFNNIDADVRNVGTVSFAEDWQFKNMKVTAKDHQPLLILDSKEVYAPLVNAISDIDFPFTLPGVEEGSLIRVANHPEFAFLLPEMAGNLKFGVMRSGESKWFSDFKTVEKIQTGRGGIYTLADSSLDGGKIVLEVLPLSASDGIVIEIQAEKIPEGTSLFWSYGGASGKILEQNESPVLKPAFCKYNVFSVEWTAFTLYYGESMRLRTVNAVMPVSSEIHLSDAHMQQSPFSFFESGKKTDSPALAAILPLKTDQKEYFCIYKQNKEADYNHYMLPALFEKERVKQEQP